MIGQTAKRTSDHPNGLSARADTPLFYEVLEQAKAIAVPTEAFEVSLKILAADRLNYGRLATMLGDRPPCEGQALAALQKVIDARPV
jgi:hypothetical protein